MVSRAEPNLSSSACFGSGKCGSGTLVVPGGSEVESGPTDLTVQAMREVGIDLDEDLRRAPHGRHRD